MIKVKKVNAFTDSINGGNPAGVLLDSPDLTDEQMAFINQRLKVTETAFVFPSNKADYKTRFFTSTIEVDLCGHATIATFFTMALEGIINQNETHVTQETNVGILPVDVVFDGDQVNRVMMTQSKAILKDICIDISNIASALNIPAEDIDSSLPQQIVSTGLFTLPICVKSFDILKNIKPDSEKIKKICNQLNTGSFHVFTFETIAHDSVYHARNFPPLYGVNEDPTTGTSNGAVCSYLKINDIIDKQNMICEQGDIMGRSGRVFVEIENDIVKVGGKAKIVEEKDIEI